MTSMFCLLASWQGYMKGSPRAPNPPRLNWEDRISLSLRRAWTWVKVICSFFEQHPVLVYHAGHLGSHLEKPPSYFFNVSRNGKSSTTINKLYWRLITLAVENVLLYFWSDWFNVSFQSLNLFTPLNATLKGAITKSLFSIEWSTAPLTCCLIQPTDVAAGVFSVKWVFAVLQSFL